MEWIVFSYSLPAQAGSSLRVTLWRRLGRLGAVSPTNGVHILPVHEDTLEAFQWLAQEIRQKKGEALVMRVSHLEGLTDQDLIGLFQAARQIQYLELDASALALEKRVNRRKKPYERSDLKEELDKLRRQYADIARIDYFDSPDAARVSAHLDTIASMLVAPQARPPFTGSAHLNEYQDRKWITRPHPHVDRLACAWLIRRFIDPRASIRYAALPEADEIAFDMAEGEFTHRGNLCTFEIMLATFEFETPSLKRVAEIVHRIDLNDGRYPAPEAVGIELVLDGWRSAGYSDDELESHGIAMFEGLYQSFESRPPLKEPIQSGRSSERIGKRAKSARRL